MLFDKGADKVGESFTEIKRYKAHWNSVANGTHNNHPGLSSKDIAAWDFANRKVNEHIAVNKVDGDALEDLRLKELDSQSKFLNGNKVSDGGGAGGKKGGSKPIETRAVQYLIFM